MGILKTTQKVSESPTIPDATKVKKNFDVGKEDKLYMEDLANEI